MPPGVALLLAAVLGVLLVAIRGTAGTADQAEDNLKRAGEKVKDAFKK